MNNILKTALLAATGAAILSQSSQAQTSFTAHDLILGIRATGGTGATTDYEVDLGLASLYYGATSPFTVLIGSGATLTDISGNFGGSWNTRNDLLWSVSGTIRSGGTVSHPN